MNGRRVFTDVAAALSRARPVGAGHGVIDQHAGWLIAVNAVASSFHEQNSAFDRERFLQDCGVLPPLPTDSISVENVALIRNHAACIGREHTIARMIEAGAPKHSANLSRVPDANRPALYEALKRDLQEDLE